MKHDPLSPCVGLGRTRDIDAPALKFIGPQRAVAATRGAIARRGRLGHPFEAPLNCTAVARTLDHFRTPSNLLCPLWQRLDRKVTRCQSSIFAFFAEKSKILRMFANFVRPEGAGESQFRPAADD